MLAEAGARTLPVRLRLAEARHPPVVRADLRVVAPIGADDAQLAAGLRVVIGEHLPQRGRSLWAHVPFDPGQVQRDERRNIVARVERVLLIDDHPVAAGVGVRELRLVERGCRRGCRGRCWRRQGRRRG